MPSPRTAAACLRTSANSTNAVGNCLHCTAGREMELAW